MTELLAPAARWARLQSIVWPPLAVQSKSPSAIASTMSRLSTVSVRLTVSASDTPALVTVRVNVWLAPPAVAVALSKVLVTLSSTSSSTVVLVVLLVSLAAFGSSVPVGRDRGRVEHERAGLGGLGQGDVDDERVITGAGREAGRVDAGHDLAERPSSADR